MLQVTMSAFKHSVFGQHQEIWLFHNQICMRVSILKLWKKIMLKWIWVGERSILQKNILKADILYSHYLKSPNTLILFWSLQEKMMNYNRNTPDNLLLEPAVLMLD